MDRYNRKKIDIRPKKICRPDGCYWIPNRCINEHYLSQRLEELGKHEEIYNAGHRQRQKEVQRELLNIRASKDTKNGMGYFKRNETMRRPNPKSRNLSLTEMIDKFKMRRVENDLLNELIKQQRYGYQYVDDSVRERSPSKVWETIASSKADDMGMSPRRGSKEINILDEMKASLETARRLSSDSSWDEIFDTVRKQKKRNSDPSVMKQNGYGRQYGNDSKMHHRRNTLHADRVEHISKRIDRPRKIIGEQTSVVQLNIKKRTPIYAEEYSPRQQRRVSRQRQKVKKKEKEQTEQCRGLVRERTLYQDDLKLTNKEKPNLGGSKDNTNLNGSKDIENLNGSKDNANLNDTNDNKNLNGSKDIGNLNGLKVIGNLNDSKDIGNFISTKENANSNGSKDNADLNGSKYIATLSGPKDSTNLNGLKDNTNLSGSKDNTNLSGSKDNKNLSGSKDNNNLNGLKDNTNLSGSKDNKNLSGSKDNSNLSGSKDKANYPNEQANFVSLKEKSVKQSIEENENEYIQMKGNNAKSKYLKKNTSENFNKLNNTTSSENESAKNNDVRNVINALDEKTETATSERGRMNETKEKTSGKREKKVKETVLVASNGKDVETNDECSISGVLHEFSSLIREPTELIYFLEEDTEKDNYGQKFEDKLARIKKEDMESGNYNDLYEGDTFDECEVESLATSETWDDVRRCRYLRGYDPPEMIMPQGEINVFVFGRDENDILEMRRQNEIRLREEAASESELDMVDSPSKTES